MTNNLPRSVRDLVRRLDRAALASGLPISNQGAAGQAAWPYASLVLAALDHDLSPILLLSDLAEHSKAIAADPRVALLFDGTAGLAQPLTGPRVTLLGRAAKTLDEGCKQRFLARHPDAATYASFKDFSLYRVVLERAHLVAGFGRISWLTAVDLRPMPIPGLAESEPAILAHMNGDHAEAIELYAGKLLGRDGQGWHMTGIDSEGVDLRQGGEVARLALDPPLASVDEVRVRLVALAVSARAV